jgi:hypothetical protein
MLRTRLPVRSALFKQHTGGLVVRWVTTGESPLLNVFLPIFVAPCGSRSQLNSQHQQVASSLFVQLLVYAYNFLQ